jgi:hypothetical protein
MLAIRMEVDSVPSATRLDRMPLLSIGFNAAWLSLLLPVFLDPPRSVLVPLLYSFYNDTEVVHGWFVSQLLLFRLPRRNLAIPAEQIVTQFGRAFVVLFTEAQVCHDLQQQRLVAIP